MKVPTLVPDIHKLEGDLHHYFNRGNYLEPVRSDLGRCPRDLAHRAPSRRVDL